MRLKLSDFYESEHMSLSLVSMALSKVTAEMCDELELTKEEMKCLIAIHDEILPWDWDRKSFRGMKLIVI